MNTGNNEIWMPIPGFTGYEVSSIGRVKSLPRMRSNGVSIYETKELIRKTPIRKGYPVVSLRSEGKTTVKDVHQLVAEAFIGPRPQGMEVCHKNGNRADPRLCNLEYGTRADNIADCKRHGTFKNGASHLTEEIVRQIAARHDDTAKVLAEEFGVSHQTIAGIRRRNTWKHLNLPLRDSYRRRGDDHPARKGKQTKPHTGTAQTDGT